MDTASGPFQGGTGVTKSQHCVRIGFLALLAWALLGWRAMKTEILYADGLRYIGQARVIERGSWARGLIRSTDHPMYPVAIAASHAALVRGERPEDWQAAAQAASVLAGVLLSVPLYLVALELFGGPSAWLGVLLFYLAPGISPILADVLSEGTFLLFWTWGLWAGLRFLREGRFGWLPLMIGCGGLAYLTRPEGLLLPAAMASTLLLMPLLQSTRLNWPRWCAAVGFLVVGPMLLVGPFVALKGGLGTKPAIQRLLGTAPRSAADAVERARPLDPDQTELQTFLKAAKAVWESVRDIVSIPLVPLAVVGVVLAVRSGSAQSRVWLLMAVMGSAALLGLWRLHVTGGYCSPRHAIVFAVVLIPAAGHAVCRLLGAVSIPGRVLGLGEGRFSAGPAVWVVVLLAYAGWAAPSLARPVNGDLAGYRQAASWVSEHLPPEGRVVDATGWTQFYASRPGYNFGNLRDAPSDPNLRYVVIREAHLHGAWWYCDVMRAIIQSREPIAVFPEHPRKGQARVFVFDRTSPQVPALSWKPARPGESRR